MKLERALCRVKQDSRQWLTLLCKTLVAKFSMEQCTADLCVFRKMENKQVVLIPVVEVYDIRVSRNKTVCEELLGVLTGQFSTQKLRELEW